MHWKSSPTAIMLRCLPARMSVNSAWSPFVSWYSSTSTYRNFSCRCSRTDSFDFRSSRPFTRRSSKSIASSSRLRAAYMSPIFAIASGSMPAVFVSQRSAMDLTVRDSFAASEMILATTSFFGKSFTFSTVALMMSPTSFFWSSSSRMRKPGVCPTSPA